MGDVGPIGFSEPKFARCTAQVYASSPEGGGGGPSTSRQAKLVTLRLTERGEYSRAGAADIKLTSSAIGPPLPTCAVQLVGRYLSYGGHGVNALRRQRDRIHTIGERIDVGERRCIKPRAPQSHHGCRLKALLPAAPGSWPAVPAMYLRLWAPRIVRVLRDAGRVERFSDRPESFESRFATKILPKSRPSSAKY